MFQYASYVHGFLYCSYAEGLILAAAACAKEELAPLALDAYPEAYPEFKRLMLLLIYQGTPGGQQGSAAAAAVAEEWDPASKAELAGQIYHTACQAQGERSF